MKIFLQIIILLLTTVSFSQTKEQKEKIEKHQNKWIKKAELEIKKNELHKAYISYNFIKDADATSAKGLIASHKLDSLKIVLRENLKNNLAGIWEIKIFGDLKSENSRKHYNRLGKYIKVSNSSIYFFKNKRDLKSNKFSFNEKIKFCDLEGIYPVYADVILENKEIWTFRVNQNREILTITENGELLSNNNRTSDVSHPSGYTYNKITVYNTVHN
jgi:hypothetical protein